IITELETLKEEASEVQRKMEETDTVMAEVDRVSQQYLPLSTSCSAMYFTLESLNQLGVTPETPQDNLVWSNEQLRVDGGRRQSTQTSYPHNFVMRHTDSIT
uniref:Uncharacterized protein n=1 Tax=Amphimedon queenslandica TaxID=400682 RepID=A0A1X7TJI5_AMPQE